MILFISEDATWKLPPRSKWDSKWSWMRRHKSLCCIVLRRKNRSRRSLSTVQPTTRRLDRTFQPPRKRRLNKRSCTNIKIISILQKQRWSSHLSNSNRKKPSRKSNLISKRRKCALDNRWVTSWRARSKHVSTTSATFNLWSRKSSLLSRGSKIPRPCNKLRSKT